MKKVLAPVPRGTGPRDRPYGGKEAARTHARRAPQEDQLGIREESLKRADSLRPAWRTPPENGAESRVLSAEEARLAWRVDGTLGYSSGPAYQAADPENGSLVSGDTCTCGKRCWCFQRTLTIQRASSGDDVKSGTALEDTAAPHQRQITLSR